LALTRQLKRANTPEKNCISKLKSLSAVCNFTTV